jgi:hypothetical protein
LEAIQEKTEHVKAMNLLTTLQVWAFGALHGERKQTMYEDTIGELEDRFGDQHLPTGYHNLLRTRTQEDGEPLQEFATATEQSIHCAFAALHEGHIRKIRRVFHQAQEDE